nr:retrotransposon protein, putative, Ty1-copia subclass [Tanacetum cinerariifolium]
MLQEVKSWLCKCLSMKDLGETAYILGINIIRDKSKRLIALSQSAYLEKILKKFWMKNSKKGYTLMIEKLDYRKSQAQYIAATEASMEAVWMRKFIDGLGGVVSSNKRPMEMLCDNKPAIVIANDLEILKGDRHFQRKYHYIREVIQEREIILKNVYTYDNVFDPFTKPMSFNKHYEHAVASGIVLASSLIILKLYPLPVNSPLPVNNMGVLLRSNVVFLILYVDDILLMGNNITMLQEVKSWLCKCLSMKDLGETAYILGINIIRDKSKRLIALSQSAYLEKILKKFWMKNSKKGYTLMIEKLDYRKSQAQYIAATEASMEAVWMRKFIDGLGGVVSSNKRPIEMLCDNKPAIVIANDLEILKGDRHFQRKYHYIREVIQEREIILKNVYTYDNVFDPFTKPMSFNKHYEHAVASGIVLASSLMLIYDVLVSIWIMVC